MSVKYKLLIFLLLCLALALRHLTVFYTSAEILHLEALADSFAMMDSGDWWVSGQLLGGSGVRFGGPLYTWLNYPARLLANPVLGAHLNNFALELASLAVWVFWPAAGRIKPDVRWVAAALLVLLPEPKAEVCENAAAMVHLLPPLLVTFLWATREGAGRSMLLPGALLGAAVTVHASAAVLGPALVATVIFQRRLAARRLLALGLGAAMVCAALLHGAAHDAEQGGQVWRWIWEHLSAGRAAALMLHLVKDPAALLGAALVLVAWRRGTRPDAALTLALLWVVTGGLLVSVLYSRLDLTWDPFWPRFALVNPGRVVLGAVGILWLLGRLDALLRARWGRELGLERALAAALVLCAVIMAAVLPSLRGRVARDRARDLSHPCLCDLVEREMWSRYRMRYFDELLQGGAAGQPGAAQARGLLGKDLAVASRWRVSQGPPARRRGARSTAVFPAMPDPGDPGQRLLIRPGCAALDTRALTRGRLALERGGRRSSDRLLVTLVSNQPGARNRAPDVSLVDSRGANRVRGLGRCACREEGPFIGGWYLFDLGGAPLDELRLVAHPDAALSWEVHGLLLPPL